ncbi:MAG: transposase [Lewinellaceae bacterium]|nr:transposase [Saprospiraceae bacterium]MCB9331375.1 transposase [Lewinellaceae bacterium]
MKIFYERNLPHWQPPGATLFLTYRLQGSIPMPVLNQIREYAAQCTSAAYARLFGVDLDRELYAIQRRWFGQYDTALHNTPNGPYWLAEKSNALIVAESIHWCAARYFELFAYCIMSNHVHLLIKHHIGAPQLRDIMKSHKGYTGLHCNKAIGRNGKYWQEETYDHVVRNDTEFERIRTYILQNPVKAGLVKRWEDWPWTFLA